MVSYEEKYGALLRGIADEADAMSLDCFRNSSLRVERKMDGTALTQADGAIEKMARKRVAESGLALDVYGEEQGTGGGKSGAAPAAGRARLIIDPIDGTEEFSRGIPTFGTLLGIELNGEIVAGMCSAPALGTRWWAYRGEGAFRNGEKIRVSRTPVLAEAMVFTTGTGPSKNAEDRGGFDGCWMLRGTAGAWADFGSTCWWQKGRLMRRWIGLRSRGIWRRWGSLWKRRAEDRRMCKGKGRFIAGII